MGYDLLIVGILVYATIRGAAKGIVWQLAAISALVLCFFFAGSFSTALAPLIPAKAPLDQWIAMALLYLIFSFVSFSLARALKDWMEKAKFEEYDRHLGGIFGFIKGSLFCLVLTFFSVTLSQGMREMVMQSHSGHAAAIFMTKVHPVIPENLHDLLDDYIHSLNDHPGIPEEDRIVHTHDDPGAKPTTPSDPFQNPSGQGSQPVKPQPNLPLPAPAFPTWPSSTQLLNNDMILKVMSAVQNAPEESRADLLKQLQSLSPEELANVVNQLDRHQIPASSPDELPFFNGQEPTPQTANTQKQIADIAAIITDSTEQRSKIIAEIESSLRGVPDQIAESAINDWHADIMAYADDPDPATQLVTPLDERLRRQLDHANFPLNNLSQDLQDRLRQ